MDDQTFLNQLAEKLSKLGTVRPLGFHYLHPYETVPADSIICNGATYSRALYKDFFDYITTQGWVKTEAEWQEIATRDNGFCPFYSDGDGSTNFRTPKFAPYQQIAMEVAQATTYHQAGLPNISGSFNSRGIELGSEKFKGTGCFYWDANFPFTDGTSGHQAYSIKGGIGFSARAANKVYGKTDTVQPESHSWVMCVVAYGVATNVGSVDIQNVMSAVNAVQAKVDNKLEASTIHITETWKATDGNSWYRVWSDGFIEQGGSDVNHPVNVTFPKPFKDIPYTLICTPITVRAQAEWANYIFANEKTSVGFKSVANAQKSMEWYACGF